MHDTDDARTLRPLSHFAARMPGVRGGATHPATLGRWITTGARMPDGSRLRLRATRVGSSWRTCELWLAEFTAALTAAHLPETPAPAPRSPSVRKKAEAEAGRVLDAAGI